MSSSIVTPPGMPTQPVQQLPREAYTCEDWFNKERHELFGRTWSYICTAAELPGPGNYLTINVGNHPLIVLRDDAGTLKAFHNLCRHRGTELLEGSGKLESTRIICPYHRWTYNLDGSLRAVPMKKKCFPDLDLKERHLFEASVGEFKGMVFAHPAPGEDLSTWLGPLEPAVWPHEIDGMTPGANVTYELNCNWKVFFENAIDGYHLAYLHDQTLGGPKADFNVWDIHGRHLVWYSTETGKKTCMPEAVAEEPDSLGSKPIGGAESGEYGGVYMLFPNTIVTAAPTEFSISRLDPVSPGVTLLRARQWVSKSHGWKWFSGGEANVEDFPGYDPDTGYLKLDRLQQHPLETGDFHWEDVWVCEKIQRSLSSPLYKVDALAQGSGAEAPLELFQRNVLDFVSS